MIPASRTARFLCAPRLRALVLLGFLAFLAATFPLFDAPPVWLLLASFAIGSFLGGLHFCAIALPDEHDDRVFNLMVGIGFSAGTALMIVGA